MELSPDQVARILRRRPEPAFTLSSVLRLTEREGFSRVSDPHVLLHMLRSRPDLFRVIEPGVLDRRTARTAVRERGPAPIHPPIEPWVVPTGPREEPWGPSTGRRSPWRVLSESVRALSRQIDTDSKVALARWARIVRETRTLPFRPRP